MFASGFFMYLLDQSLYFPPLATTHSSGIIAVGGDLSTERLLLAYRSGIFPWYEDDTPVTWWSPEWRMVFFPQQYAPSKSIRKILRQNDFSITYNQCFEEVISACQSIKRNGQMGTWITDDMRTAYMKLHDLGVAKSIEVWQHEKLVGGLYGIDLGTVFCGESMFSKVSQASKVAFHYLMTKTKEENYILVDGQVYNDYLDQLGFVEIHREDFELLLHKALRP